VEDQEQLVVEPENDPLADASQTDDRATDDLVEGRLHRSQEERAGHARTRENVADHPWLEPVEIELDVG
jgi:hypothetical protein